MLTLAIILTLTGLFILVGIGVWVRMRRTMSKPLHVEKTLEQRQTITQGDAAPSSEAVLVAREYGQLVYVNSQAKQWLGLRTGTPSLEHVARNANPTDSFRSLFAGASHATFQLGDRWVEGTAMQVPAENEIRTVVTLRELNGGNGNGHTNSAGQLDVSASMQIIAEIGETVNASLSVEQVLQAILTIIGKYVPIDAGEICLFDERDGMLHQRGWVGDSAYVLALANAGGAYGVGEGISGWVARYKEPLLVPDVTAPDAVKPKMMNNQYRSFVAVPLMLGERFIGTLELVHGTPGHFKQSHLALLQTLVKPTATAIYNAELYSAQIQRIDDIASLQRVAQTDAMESDVASVFMTLNERIAQLIEAEVCGILLYDSQRELAVGQTPFFGLPDGLVRALAIPVKEGAPAHGIWTRQTAWVSNDPYDNDMVEAMGIAPIVVAAGLRNIALVVMRIGRQRIGMVMVANKTALSGFTTPDMQNLKILVAQAAIVVENVRLFQREQRQDTELVGLQEITHAIGALSNENEVFVYSDINVRIAGLMNIQMCGVLLYDEERNALVAQPPFYGVSIELIDGYEIDLSANEVIGEIWEEQDFWYSNRAMADTLVYSAGLAEMAERVGVEKTLIASLTVGGRKIGAVQVSNKHSGEDFNDNDARLLMIFATQAAAIIQNARLVREVQRRAEEADRLRLIAERAGNLVSMDETLAPVLSEVARLLESQLAFLSVHNPETGTVITHPRAVFGAELDVALRYDPSDATTMSLVTLTQQPLIANDPAATQEAVAYQQIAQLLGIERMLVVPLLIGDRSLGELGIANRRNPYDETDVELLTSVATQLGATIDRVRLFEAAEVNLEHRVRELEAISNISKTLNETLEVNAVLDSVRREVAAATDADGSTVIMTRDVSNWDQEVKVARVAMRIGEEDLFDGLAENERAALATPNTAYVVNNYAATDLHPQPSNARSAIAIAFTYASIPVGVIHLHDTREAYFDERAGAFLKTVALKASLGFGNAVRQQEQFTRNRILIQRVDQLNQIFELGQMLQTDVDPDVMLEAIAYSIVQSVGFDVVVITMIDPADGLLKRKTQAGLPVEIFERSKADVLPANMLGDLLQDDLRISESYFFPLETILEWEIAGLDALSAAYTGNRTIHAEGPNAWRDGDMMLVPITGAGGELLGIMSLDRPQDNRRPTQSRAEVLEIFAHQAAATIENNRLYLESVRNAEQEAMLNEMLEDVASTLNINDIVESVAHNMLRLVPFQHMTVALQDDAEQGYILYQIEVTPEHALRMAKERKGNLDYTALARTINSGADYVYTRQNDIAAYKDLTELHGNGERVSVILPLNAGGQTMGALHLGSHKENNLHLETLRTTLSRIASLTAVAIQNARLFNQAVNLQVFNESVVDSIQQGIVVMDRSGRVISSNRFLQDEYGWNINEMGVRRDIFDYEPELADVLAEPLRTVLETGEPFRVINHRTQQDNNTIVRNFYVYPLVSREVINGAVLLIEDVTERASLEADLEARAAQLAALTRTSGMITSTLQREQVIELALDAMQEIVDYDTMSIWRRIDPETMQLVGIRGLNIEMNPPIRARVADVTRIQHIIETSHTMTIDHLPHYLETYAYSLPGDAGSHSWLGAPLIHQGYVIGMVVVTKEDAGFYTSQAEQAAITFANQVAVAITNAELFTETRARTERLSVLNRVSLALVQSMDSENIFEIALTEIANALNSEQARAIVFDRNAEVGRVIVDYPRGEITPTQQFRIRKRSVYRYILDRRQPLVYSHDIANMPETLDDDVREEIEVRGLRDYLLLPMMATGRMIGAFEFETRTKTLTLGAEALEIGLIIANQTAIAIQNANQLEEITTRTRELETLLEAAQSTSMTMDLQKVFATVVELMLNTLDVDDCAIMILDDLEDTLQVQIDVNRDGNQDRVSPVGTLLNVSEYPAKAQALRTREVIVIHVDDPRADAREIEELREQNDQARMLVPLVMREQSIGLIQVELTDPNRRISEQERRLARALGSQVAIAIDNARLSTETAAQIDELFIINDLSQAISSTINVDQMLKIVREQVPAVTGASEMYVALYDNDTQMISFPLAIRDRAQFNIPPRKLNSDEVSFVIRNKRPLNLDNNYFSAEELRNSLGLTNGEGDVNSYLGVPLVSGDEVLGVLAVSDRERTRAFGLNDQRILTTVGSQLGAMLQNARLFERIQNFANDMNELVQDRTQELQEERDRLDMLYQITAELALTLDMDRVLSRALQMIASAIKANDGVIMLIDPMTDKLYNRASLSRPSIAPDEDRQTHPAEALAYRLIHDEDDEHELLVDDLHQEDFWDRDVMGAEQWRSAIAVLLETNEDVQGALVLLNREVAAFPAPLLNLVTAAANQVASAINNADLYQLIRDQAERLGTLLRTEQEEAEKSNAILEGIADGVMLTDDQGRISRFNSAAEEMLGLARDEVMQRTLDELIDAYGESVATWAQPILERTQSGGVSVTNPFLANRLNVGDRVVSVNIAPVHTGPQYLGAVSVFRDVTRDVEVDNLKNEFIRRATHELRTPLTPIKGFASMMLTPDDGMSDTVRQQIEIIKANADRLADLVEDLLTVSTIDAGDSRMVIEPTDVASIVDVQVKNAQNRHYGKRLTVQVNAQQDLPTAMLDRAKTMQIVGNIIDNAFNYTLPGGNINITLGEDPNQDSTILLTVADSGVGIPVEFQDKVWERFVRFEDHALEMDIPGTGLGLSIVHELVRMHGGEVWFDSEENVGTTFYVRLPIEYSQGNATR